MDDTALSDASTMEACEFLQQSLATATIVSQQAALIQPAELALKLKDGVLLCELVNCVAPGSIPKISTKQLPFLQMENINNALKACRELGIGNDDLFEMRELFEQRSIRNIVRCILALKKVKNGGSIAKPSLVKSTTSASLGRPPVPRSISNSLANAGNIGKQAAVGVSNSPPPQQSRQPPTALPANQQPPLAAGLSSASSTNSLSAIAAATSSPTATNNNASSALPPNLSVSARIGTFNRTTGPAGLSLPPILATGKQQRSQQPWNNQRSLAELSSTAASSPTGSNYSLGTTDNETASKINNKKKNSKREDENDKVVSLHNIAVSVYSKTTEGSASPPPSSRYQPSSGANNKSVMISDSAKSNMDTQSNRKQRKQGGRRLSHASQVSQSTELLKKSLVIESPAGSGIMTEYQFGECVGKGQFGVVYRGVNQSTGAVVAIKRIKMDSQNHAELESLMTEVELLRSLQHENIIRYEACLQQDEYLNIILEFAENGSLRNTIKQFGALPERLAVYYAAGVLEGLVYLHGRNVIHCDLKAANILTTKNGVVKLSDFGVSKQVLFDEKDISVAGTPNWMAPEIIELKGATTASDIWSLGCTLVEFITGKPPYANCNAMTALFRIVEETMPVPETVSADLQDLLRQCFNKDSSKRPTAQQLLQHPWISANREIIENLRKAARVNASSLTKSLAELLPNSGKSAANSMADLLTQFKDQQLSTTATTTAAASETAVNNVPPISIQTPIGSVSSERPSVLSDDTGTANSFVLHHRQRLADDRPSAPTRSCSQLQHLSAGTAATSQSNSYSADPGAYLNASNMQSAGDNLVTVGSTKNRHSNLSATSGVGNQSNDALPGKLDPPSPAGNGAKSSPTSQPQQGGDNAGSVVDQLSKQGNSQVSSGEKTLKIRRKDWSNSSAGATVGRSSKNADNMQQLKQNEVVAKSPSAGKVKKTKKKGGCQIL